MSAIAEFVSYVYSRSLRKENIEKKILLGIQTDSSCHYTNQQLTMEIHMQQLYMSVYMYITFDCDNL